MSAVVIIRGSDRATVMTDRALYDPVGRVVGFGQKARIVESWQGVLTFRGNYPLLLIAADIAERFGSFDEFLMRSGPVIRGAALEAVSSGHLPPNFAGDLHVAGWSEGRDRPEVYVLDTDPRLAAGAELYVWRPAATDGVWTSPMLTRAEEWTLHRGGAEYFADYEPEEFDFDRHGRPLMEVLRRQRADEAFVPGRPFVIGGGVDVYTVTRDDVEWDQPLDWPDEAGEFIQPGPLPLPQADRAPSFVPEGDAALWWSMKRAGRIDPETLMERAVAAPMNRAERRRARARERV